MCGAGPAIVPAAGQYTCGTVILIKLWCYRFFINWVIFMNLLCISIIQKNKLIYLVLFLIFLLMSAYMPLSLNDAHEHHDYEILLKHIINNGKPSICFKKFLKKIRILLIKICKLSQILSNTAVLANMRLALFNKRFSEVLVFYLFFVLCSYFHGGKFKQNNLHSYSLQAMGA